MKWLSTMILILFLFVWSMSGCEQIVGASKTFTILSSSENQVLEPMIQQFAEKQHISVKMVYKGSVDIMAEIEKNSSQYDAVWAANSLWITMGDKLHKVKNSKSIMTSPVVFGIKKSLARELGFVNKEVKVKQIADAVKKGKLKFVMTSATQSNSGASAYIGFIYALLGNPESITLNDLNKPELKNQVKELLKGVNRSSGSSEWLKDLFLKGNYDAMVNYEAVIIETNQELIKQGKEPLYLVYPVDGLTIADYTLGYINNGQKEKETFFNQLQSFLLSDQIQAHILKLGRRTGYGGTVEKADPQVFNPEWGIDTKKTLSSIRFPETRVITEALKLYQTTLRKPSYTVFALDFSGSMEGEGARSLKAAMKIMLDQKEAEKYYLQSSYEDRAVVIPFDYDLREIKQANDVQSYGDLLQYVENLKPGGGTDIYHPVITGLDLLKNVDTDQYHAAIILMTDGKSEGDIAQLQSVYQKLNKDIPVFCVTFGDASTEQLNMISELTRGRVFDGQSNLLEAFRKAKGYN